MPAARCVRICTLVKALTMTQPWAMLVALCENSIESRSLGRKTYELLSSVPAEARDEGWQKTTQQPGYLFSRTLKLRVAAARVHSNRPGGLRPQAQASSRPKCPPCFARICTPSLHSGRIHRSSRPSAGLRSGRREPRRRDTLYRPAHHGDALPLAASAGSSTRRGDDGRPRRQRTEGLDRLTASSFTFSQSR